MTVSSTSADLQLMRASLLLESDPAAAARRASDILGEYPGHAEASLLLAAACRRLGDPARSAAALESLADFHRNTPLMQLELGRAYAADGRGPAAIAAFSRAVELSPDLADGWRDLAAQLFAAGELSAGDVAYANYSRLTPAPPELSDAAVALSDYRLEAAEAMLRRRLEQAPHDVVALRMFADAAIRREDFAKAQRRLTDCLELAPGYAPARYDLANVLLAQQRASEVLPHVDRLLASEPGNIDCLSVRAHALRLLGRSDEAIALMEQAIAEHPDDDRAWLLCGHLLREVGQGERTIEMYRRALAVRPQSGQAYWSLANLKTFRFAGTDITAMQEQLARSGPRSTDRTQLEFALGKALEDEGQFAASFEHYARANALHRATLGSNVEVATSDVQRSKALYNTGFFAERSGWGSERSDPIFIVGLPRSGSTLIEQMLASHSQVEGTRELMELPAIAFELNSRTDSPGYPEVLATLGKAEIEALGARYLERTRQHRSLDTPRFVDKMLGNFGHVALIHLIFPHAAIIDARRHPLGCGFSCYKQLFPRGLGFTYDLTELGHFYRDYAGLMDHFDTVLPNRVYRVHYERLVADPEGELRKLLEHCGLPFEQQCLRFYETRRSVQTISSEQVRQPIYTESVDQWRHYESWLGPLKEALGDLSRYYPASLPAPG